MTLKPSKVLSARFGTPDSCALEGYRRDGGYATYLDVVHGRKGGRLGLVVWMYPTQERPRGRTGTIGTWGQVLPAREQNLKVIASGGCDEG